MTADIKAPEAGTEKPYLGYGLGLRPPHYPAILDGTQENGPPANGEHRVDWFEVISENFMEAGGAPRRNLARVRERYPVVMHGVSLSLGGPDPLDMDYLARLKDLISWLKPEWVSDHLCWTGADGINLHDLLPLPFTREAVRHVATRIKQVQDFLGQKILLENASSYVTFRDSEMTEWEFLKAIVEEADCNILFDVNNVYVSAFNHDFDPLDYLDAMPAHRILQMHLAGHENNGDYIVDTHDHPVIDPVWALYAQALKRFGPVSTMIERDDNIPPFEDLVAELDKARAIGDAALEGFQTRKART